VDENSSDGGEADSLMAFIPEPVPVCESSYLDDPRTTAMLRVEAPAKLIVETVAFNQ
jgi:hypothetical protein